MEAEINYFAYCLDTNTKTNYFITSSKFLKPRPNARHLYPGYTSHTLGQQFWGVVLQSAWHESLEVNPDDGTFLDQSPDKDFEHLLTEAEYKECLVLATASSVQELQEFVQSGTIKIPNKYRRLNDSDASGSQQHDELQQRNKKVTSSESNLQTSNKDNSTDTKSSDESNSTTLSQKGGSVQELQHRVIAITGDEVPHNKRRIDDSVASSGQQEVEPQQQNKKFRSCESNQETRNEDYSLATKSSEESNSATISRQGGATPFIQPAKDTDIEMEGPNESHNVSGNKEKGDTHKRPEGVANLGVFESEKDGRVNADNVCVLVIHYEFKDNRYDTFRKGDACDVKNLKTFFGENRNCNFRDLSPNKNDLLQLLGDEEKLMQFFKLIDDVPSVFVLFILSHGTENGIILTDHFDGETIDNERFTTDEVFDSLQKLKRFDKCLKVVNFGPCRGEEDDSKFNIRKSYKGYANKNSCRITNRPGMHNCVVFYSTVETTSANIDENGSWFVRYFCTCLNSADDEALLKFFTIVQNRMHQASLYSTSFVDSTPLGQTPELKMFQQDRKFIISKARITAELISYHDATKADVSKVQNEPFPKIFTWKSDEEYDIRGRRGFILSVAQSKQVKDMKRALRKLDFEITDWTLNGQSLDFYINIVSTELEPDVGCILTCIFGPVCENEEKEVCVRVGKKTRPIKNILYSLVGPNNNKLIGKPKIVFVVNMEAPQRDCIFVDMKDLLVTATNHSGWLVLILKHKDALEKLIELFENIGEKCLQELLDPLLTRESNSEKAVLLNSTLQYLINFPNWPRAFVKPNFKLKMTNISGDQMISLNNSTEFPVEQNINFDELLVKAKSLFEKNKESKETKGCLEEPQISRDESSKKSDSIRDFEAISAARDSADASIVWIFNSVAGAGKSTVLKEMAHQLTKSDEGFKILRIPLKDKYQILRELYKDVIEFLAKTTCNFHDDIINWIEKRELIVFFDGFDEACPEFRSKIIEIMIALNNASVPLFIGTRPHEVHHIQERIKNTTIVEIEPLDEAKQIEFLQIVTQKKQEEIDQLRNNFEEQDILGNPLYLKLLAEYSDDKNLYEIFDKIVRRKVEIYLENEIGSKDVGPKVIDKSLKFIQLVAFRFLKRKTIDKDGVTKEELEKMNAFGVVTYYNDRVNFTHQMFAEFLTAQKFLYDLKNPYYEKVTLFDDELLQCRKFVDLFFSTEKGKEASYAKAFRECATSTDTLELVQKFCRENLRHMFECFKPNLSLIRDEDGKNALHFALQHLEMVKMVHEKDSNLATEKTKNGESCLHLAIDDAECSEKVALWILEHTEVDKNAETKIKGTPLLLAGLRQKWKVAKYLLSTNVEVNKLSADGKSILHYAVQSNELDLVQAILKNITNINLKDGNGVTALHIAAGWNKNLEIVKMLIEKGAEVNAQDNKERTALHYAAENNSVPEIIQKLLENGANVDSKDQVGFTALHLAAGWNKNPEIVKLLIENGAEVNAIDGEKRTALHYLIARANPVAEVVRELLENGAKVHSKEKEGFTALHLAACWNKSPEIVEILFKEGAEVNKEDRKKRTALHYAAEKNPDTEVVRKLLENGAKVDSQDENGFTALHLAARWNRNPEVVQILLDNNARVNIKDKYKWTALLYAAKYNPSPEIVQKLLEKDGDIKAENFHGETALFLAAKYNPVNEIIQKLREYGAKVNEMIRDDKECVAVLNKIK